MNSFFTAKEIMAGIYAIGGEAVVRYLILGEHHALLFDTGYGFGDISKFVKTLTDLPLYVVNSHGHVDHAGGNFYFDGPVYMHPADIEVYKRHQSREFRDITWQELRKMQRVFFFMGNIIPKRYDREVYLKGPVFDHFLPAEDGQTWDLGGMVLEAIEIPGHTPGSIGLYCRKKRLFFSGDGMNGSTWLFLPESCSLAVYLNSLKRVKQLDFDYMLGGHSMALEPKTTLDDYIDVAENLDFLHGKIMKPSSFAPEVEIRYCCSMKPAGNKKKASLQISADKL